LHLNPVNMLGVVGELYLAGAGGRDYLKKSKATAERFVPDAQYSHSTVVC